MSIKVENRPWGFFEQFTLNEPCTVKILYISPNMRLSKQYHCNRTELWQILRGSALATCNGEKRILTVGDTITIPRGAIHRLKGRNEGATILEISFGDFDELDIVRIEDDHGRDDNTKSICVIEG